MLAISRENKFEQYRMFKFFQKDQETNDQLYLHKIANYNTLKIKKNI